MNYRHLCAVVIGALLGFLSLTPIVSAQSPSSSVSRIHRDVVGGSAAGPDAFPSVAFISTQFANGSGETCTGAVVSPDLVLTAGHCAEDILTHTLYPPRDFDVVTGRANLSDSTLGQELTVSHVWIDPAYDPPSETDDAALLQLSRQTTSPALQLATYPDLNLLTAGTNGQVAGWGKTSADAELISQTLRTTSLTVQDQGSCVQSWGTMFDPNSQFCVLNTPATTSGTCSGDSGAPLIVSDNGAPTELGFAIYVAEGCSTTIPDVFTRVDAIAGWAEAEIAAVGNDGASASPQTADLMTRAVAYARSKRLIHKKFRAYLRGNVRLQLACVRLDRSGFLCRAAWSQRETAFAGSIAVSYAIQNGKEVVDAHSTVRPVSLKSTK